MKVATVLGTRPEIIRLCRRDRAARRALRARPRPHRPELRRRRSATSSSRSSACARPTAASAIRGRRLRRAGRRRSSPRSEARSTSERPDRAAGPRRHRTARLAAFVAKRLGIPVFHMEAGNRCFDDRVPEEVNRRIIDHGQRRAAAVHRAQPREPAARGLSPRAACYVDRQPDQRGARRARGADRAPPRVLARSGSRAGELPARSRCTARRTSTSTTRLEALLAEARATCRRALGLPVVFSVHPRTRERLERLGLGAARRCGSSPSRSASSTSSRSSATPAACSPTAARSRRSAASCASRR